jgi:hypothetical protein
MEKVKTLIKMYPEVKKYKNSLLDAKKESFKISDYNEILNQEFNGSFFDFIFKIINFANYHSVRSIKQIFDDENFVNELNEKGETLYIIAKGSFAERNFVVKATSSNKYIAENYVISEI